MNGKRINLRESRILMLFLALCVVAVAMPQLGFAQKKIIFARNEQSPQSANDNEIAKALGTEGITRQGVFIPGLGYNVITKNLNRDLSPEGDDLADFANPDPVVYADLVGADLLFVSQSILSAELSQQHLDDDIPIIQTESALYGTTTGKGSMWFGTNTATSANVTAMTIINDTHDITRMFGLGEIPAYTSTGPEMGRVNFNNTVASGAVPLVDAVTAGQAWLSVVEKGGAMDLPGMTLPTEALQRRVCLGLMQNSFGENCTPEVAYLLQRTVQWAIGDPVTAGEVVDPVMVIEPSYLDFGLMVPGAAKVTRSFTIKNEGADGSVLNITSLDEATLGDFTLESVKKNNVDVTTPLHAVSLAKEVDTVVVTIGIAPGAATPTGFTSVNLGIMGTNDALQEDVLFPLSVTVGTIATGPNYNNGVLTIDTTAGTWVHSGGSSFTGTIASGKYNETSGVDGPAGIEWDYGVCTFEFDSVFIGAAVSTVTVVGENALRIVATGDITIDKSLNLNGENGSLVKTAGVVNPGSNGGPGGFAGGDGGAASANITDGQGPGGGIGSGDATWGNGGGYGGLGGNWQAPRLGGFTWGDDLLETLLGGSGGGGCQDGASGGGGGGAIELSAAGTVTIAPRCVISANGGAGSRFNDSNLGGGASGGGIRIVADKVTNMGSLQANGGAGGYNTGQNQTRSPSGGGGRVAILYNSSLTPADGGTIAAAQGATPSAVTDGDTNRGLPGEDGTVVVRQSGPRIHFEPDFIDFGVMKQGSGLQTLVLTITNTGTAGSTLIMDGSNDDNLPPFTVISREINGAPAILPISLSTDPNDKLIVTVEFNPVTVGAVVTSSITFSNDQETPAFTYTGRALVRANIPPVTDGLVMHFDPEEGVTKDASDIVSAWADVSGNGNDATQGNPDRKPLYVADGLNGKPVIRFDGSADGLKYGDIGTYPELTIISLHKGNNYSAWGSVISSDGQKYGTVHYGARSGDAFGCYVDEQGLTDRDGMVADEVYVSAVVDDGIAYTNYLNNEEPVHTAYDGAVNNNAVNKTMGPGAIGLWIATSSAPGRFFQGDIAEILVFNRALDPSEINDVGYYLQEKFELPLTFTAPAPKVVATPSSLNLGWVSQGAMTSGTIRLENVGSIGTTADFVGLNTESLSKFSIISAVKNGTTPLSPPYATTLEKDAGDYIDVTIGLDTLVPANAHEIIWSGWTDASTIVVPPPLVGLQINLYANIGEPSLPPVMDGLVMHMAADNVIAPTDNQPAPAWYDTSGNGNHGEQAEVLQQPIYIPNVINGKPVLRFDGDDDEFQSKFVTESTQADITIITVMNTDGTVGTGYLHKGNEAGWESGEKMWWFGDSGQTTEDLIGLRPSQVGWGNGWIISDTDVPSGVPHILSWKSDYTQGAGALAEWVINGTVTGLAVNSSTPVNADRATDVFWIGKGRKDAEGVGPGNFKGDIAEILIYDRALSPLEQNRIGWYLQGKYGISGTYTQPVPRPFIVVDPVSIDFGLTAIDGPPITRTFTIADAGFQMALEIEKIEESKADFSILGAKLNGVSLVAPYPATLSGDNDDVLEVTVAFGPKPLGSYTGNIVITSNDPDRPTLEVPLSAQASPWTSMDIGDVGAAGSTAIVGVAPNEVITIEAAGEDIWNQADEFHYAFMSLKGDGSMTAHLQSIEPNTNGWIKAGVMIRETLDADSKHANANQTKAQNRVFQARDVTGGDTTRTDNVLGDAPSWVRAERIGDEFFGYVSDDGIDWTPMIGSPRTILMAEDVYIGLSVTSHEDAELVTAIFDSVSYTGNVFPTPPPFGSPSGLDLADADDLGVSNMDNVTKAETGLTISGTGYEGSIITLYDGAIDLTSGAAADFASPGFDVNLAPGVHSITAVAELGEQVSAPSAALVITVDAQAPAISLSSTVADIVENALVPVTATCSEPIYGFTFGDLTVTNGTASNLVGADGDSLFTFDMTAADYGTVSVDIAAGTVMDLAGNATTVSATLSRLYSAGVTLYELTPIVVGGGGVILSDPVGTMHVEDSAVVLTAVSDTGYDFAGWSGEIGQEDPMATSISITMNENKSVMATFTIQTFTLATTAHGGVITLDPTQATYDYGTTVTVSVAAKVNYTFLNWTGDVPAGSELLTEFEITMDANKTIEALFEADSFTLTPVVTNGTIAVVPEQELYMPGTTVTLTAAPGEGYKFMGWTGDATGMETSIVVTMDADKSIEAVFELLAEYTLTLTAAAGGSAMVDPEQDTYTEGTVVTVTATPAEGYDFEGWTGDVSVTTNPLVLTMDADKSLEATFVMRTYMLTVLATNGSVSATPETPTYDHGTTVSLVATADAYYSFTGWVGADVPVGSELDNPLILTINAAKSVEATFTIDTWVLTATAADGGAVAVTPEQTAYDHGSTVSVTATPEAGWLFLGWTGDVESMDNPLVITMDADMTVQATFRELPAAGDFKVTYKNCTSVLGEVVDGVANLMIDSASDKASIKIVRLKKAPKNWDPVDGKFFYAQSLRAIPLLSIAGPFGKLSTDAEVWELKSLNAIKSISTKSANIAWIEAASVGGIKNTAFADTTTGKVATCSVMITGSGKATKLSFSGIILENLSSMQPIKSLTVATKAFKSASKAKLYSLGGIGAAARVIAQAQGLENIPVAGDSVIDAGTITSISAKGAPMTPDTITAGLSKVTVKGGSFKTSTVVTVAADLVVRSMISTTPMKSITAKAKKVSGVAVGGKIGVLSDPTLTNIQVTGEIGSVTGQDISVTIKVGDTGMGIIKKITAKGSLAGSADVSGDIKIKAGSDLGFVVDNQ